MSSFTGPNHYLIESAVKEHAFLSLEGGSKDDGAKVVTNSTAKNDAMSIWAFVYLGIGDSGKEEYHILNRATGRYLTATSDGKNRDPITCSLQSPWRNIVRWSVVSLRNHTGLYWLVPISNRKSAIGISGGKANDGAQAITWENTSTDKDMYWYLRLAPDAITNSVDVGRGPNPE